MRCLFYNAIQFKCQINSNKSCYSQVQFVQKLTARVTFAYKEHKNKFTMYEQHARYRFSHHISRSDYELQTAPYNRKITKDLSLRGKRNNNNVNKRTYKYACV